MTSALYKGAGFIGRFSADVTAVICYFIAIIAIVGGLLVMNKDPYIDHYGREQNPRRSGLRSILLGIIIGLIGYLYRWIMYKFSFLAALSGAGDVVRLIS